MPVSQTQETHTRTDGQAPGLEYLEDESLVENWTEILALYFCLILFLFVWQQKDFDVGVRGAPHVHSGQVLSLEDPHDQLQETEGGSLYSCLGACLLTMLPHLSFCEVIIQRVLQFTQLLLFFLLFGTFLLHLPLLERESPVQHNDWDPDQFK